MMIVDKCMIWYGNRNVVLRDEIREEEENVNENKEKEDSLEKNNKKKASFARRITVKR